MTEAEHIQELKKELEQLYKAVKTQEQRIVHLHQQLQTLQRKEKGPLLPTAAPVHTHTGLENFIGLRLIHLIGIVVLVIGLSISVKYAIDRNLISEGMRVALAYAAGALLLLLSWRLKKGYAVFSAILFSGAMASFYFTTYAAFVYYSMLPPVATFALMVVLTVFTAYQAIVYNRQEIAILGMVGAYAIPFLISSNADRADLFFTYIALINAAVVFLSYKKGWQLVSYLAQAITWILLIGWAAQREGSGQLAAGTSFALFFFVLFMAHALAHKITHSTTLTKRQTQDVWLNNTALFITFYLLHAPHFSESQTATVSGLFALFCGGQAALAHRLLRTETGVKKGLAGMSLALLLLYIGAQWDGIIVTLLWLIVAVALFSWGALRKGVWLRLTGMVLMGATLLKLVVFDSLRFTPVQKIIAYLTLGVLLLLVGFFYQKFKEKLFGMDKE